eukprot:TRINITY_DN20800_c0_g1_i1.p1 TRINITY_DN20800_c0_g1~~TRINITY_DN20800_c0_g1_i1.p1  ORF type:complete len:334 (-),score=86.01 TRINITY_DN20800_c0_g1_i1:429-1310(-)
MASEGRRRAGPLGWGVLAASAVAVCRSLSAGAGAAYANGLAAARGQSSSSTAASQSRREMIAAAGFSAASGLLPQTAWAEFTPGDLGGGGGSGSSGAAGGAKSIGGVATFGAQEGSAQPKKLPSDRLDGGDQAKLKDALILISRVQEATAQEERLVTTGNFKDLQRNSIKMALNMMLDNYQLNDQIVLASGWADKDKVQKAKQSGDAAVETLQTALEYFAKELKVKTLSDEQRKFIQEAMVSCRTKLEDFLSYMPQDQVKAARRFIEDENALIIREYKSEGAILNPVREPWKA